MIYCSRPKADTTTTNLPPLGPDNSDFRSFATASLAGLQYPSAEVPKFCKLRVEQPHPLIQNDHTVANPTTTIHYELQELQLLKITDICKRRSPGILALLHVKDVKRHIRGRKGISPIEFLKACLRH